MENLCDLLLAYKGFFLNIEENKNPTLHQIVPHTALLNQILKLVAFDDVVVTGVDENINDDDPIDIDYCIVGGYESDED